MIRVVTLTPVDPADIAWLVKVLYGAFGLGTQHVGDRPMPADAAAPDGSYDAPRLLSAAEPVRVVADDKVLYLTDAPLTLEPGPLGAPPAWGFADYGRQRALVSTANLPARGVTEASINAWRSRLAREASHVIGHLWDLHHCYDAKCAMHPSWSPVLLPAPGHDLCTFCREKSERKIRLAKT